MITLHSPLAPSPWRHCPLPCAGLRRPRAPTARPREHSSIVRVICTLFYLIMQDRIGDVEPEEGRAGMTQLGAQVQLDCL